MKDTQSLSHVSWECKYHIVWVPKYRRKVLYGNLRRRLGEILKDLCRQKGVELVEGHAMVDHLHVCLSFPQMVLVLDNARYHHAKAIQTWLKEHRKMLALDFLPPYS